MKKILTSLLVVLLVLWTPYFVQTYNLKTLTASDLPAEGSWAPLKEAIYITAGIIQMLKLQIMKQSFWCMDFLPHFVWDGMKGFLLDAGYSILVFDHYGRGYSERKELNKEIYVFVQSLKVYWIIREFLTVLISSGLFNGRAHSWALY